MNATSTRATFCAIVAVTLAGCATTQGGPRQSALDRSISQCMATVAIGALLGGLVSHDNRRKGALIGGGLGAVACGVLIAINNERDKQQIRDAQLVALNAGTPQTQQFVGNDGQTRVVQTSVQEVATPPARVMAAVPTPPMSGGNPNPGSTMAGATSPDTFVGPCRNAQTTITVQGQSAQLSPDLYCRTAGGDWKLYGG